MWSSRDGGPFVWDMLCMSSWLCAWKDSEMLVIVVATWKGPGSKNGGVGGGEHYFSLDASLYILPLNHKKLKIFLIFITYKNKGVCWPILPVSALKCIALDSKFPMECLLRARKGERFYKWTDLLLWLEHFGFCFLLHDVILSPE